MNEQMTLEQEEAMWKQKLSEVDANKSNPEPAKADAGADKPVSEITKAAKPEEVEKKVEVESEASNEKPTEETPSDFQKPKLFDDDKKLKEEQRREKSWVEINKRKEALEKERLEFEKAKQDFIQRTKDEIRQEYRKKRPDLFELKPEHYFEQEKALEQRAEALEREENYAEANKLRKEAALLHKQGIDLESQTKAWRDEESQFETRQKEYEQKVAIYKKQQFDELNQKYPDLKDASKPLRQMIDKLYQDPQIVQLLKPNPNEYWFAVKVAELSLKAESASALESENKKLKEELLKERKGRTPAMSAEGGTPQKKNIADMSLKDQEAYWKQQAMAYDSR